jgi:hypothetical protein
MKVFFALVVIAGFGYWMNKEMQHEQELQSQLDEAKKQIEAYQHLLGQSRSSQQIGVNSNQQSGGNSSANWMWGNNAGNPLNAPAVPVLPGRAR